MSVSTANMQRAILKVIGYPEKLLIKLGIRTHFQKYLYTAGTDFAVIEIPRDINPCKLRRRIVLQFWCLNMSPRFKDVRQFTFYKGSYGVFLIFDKDAINKIATYKEIIEEVVRAKPRSNLPVIIAYLKDESEPQENLDKFSEIYQQLKTITEEECNILKFSQIILEQDRPWSLRKLLTHAAKELCRFVMNH